MRKLIAKFLRDKCATAAIEHGLIVAFIAHAIIAGATMVGTQISAAFTTVGGTLSRIIVQDRGAAISIRDDHVEIPIVIAAGVALAILLGLGVTGIIASHQAPGHRLSDVVREQPTAMGELLGVLRRLGAH
jgi:pilus assembly protein Flp/PilA